MGVFVFCTFLVILFVWNPFPQGNGDKIHENPIQEEKGKHKKKNKIGRRVKQNKTNKIEPN